MWIFTRYGFYSIACARKPDGKIDSDTIMIRARASSHLTNLKRRFPSLEKAELVTLPSRDYRYRLIVAKAVWATIVNELAQEQEWSNFKSEAQRYQGSAGAKYVDALHDVWSRMYRLQA